MTRIQKAIVDYTKVRDSEISPFAEFIFNSMTGNANFPTPTPSLGDVKALVDDFSAALVDAASRDRNKIAIKNELRLQVNAALNQLGNYVNTQCNGDVTKIVSSGFKLSKTPQPRYLSEPENFTVKPGLNAGSLITKIKADKAATGYTHMMTAAPVTDNSIWTSVTSSRSQYEFTGLIQGKEYTFKVAVIGSNNQVAVSATVNKFSL